MLSGKGVQERVEKDGLDLKIFSLKPLNFLEVRQYWLFVTFFLPLSRLGQSCWSAKLARRSDQLDKLNLLSAERKSGEREEFSVNIELL